MIELLLQHKADPSVLQKYARFILFPIFSAGRFELYRRALALGLIDDIPLDDKLIWLQEPKHAQLLEEVLKNPKIDLFSLSADQLKH